MKGQSPPDVTFIGKNTMWDSVFVNCLWWLKELGIRDQSYALNPVGSSGFQQLFSESTMLPTFLGYNVSDCPPNIKRAWVILMVFELIRTTPPDRNELKQAWSVMQLLRLLSHFSFRFGFAVATVMHGDHLIWQNMCWLCCWRSTPGRLQISFDNAPWKDSPPGTPTSWMMLLMWRLKRTRALLQGSNQFHHHTLEMADFLNHLLLSASEEENVVGVQLGLPALTLEGVDVRTL